MTVKRLLITLVAMAAMSAASPAFSLVRMFVHQDVNDYDAWRQVWNGADADRRRLGVVFWAVFRSPEKPNEVTFLQDFATLGAAKAYAESPEFKSAMEKGGVKGKPDVWFASKALN